MAKADLGLGLALIAVAGCVDAIGFLHLSGLFVSFMSGNSTKMAIAVIHGDRDAALRGFGIVTLFIAGSLLGRLLGRTAGRWSHTVVLGAVALLLAVAPAIRGTGLASAIPIVLAMGVQNTALRKVGPMRASLTYITGTLAHLGERLADSLLGAKQTWIPYAMMWIGMVAGALAGTACYDRVGVLALFVPAVAVAGLAAISLMTTIIAG